ncbi:MAG: MBL fold metallo-hydrolase [Lachnospiraceae bacterium]|nr:MBL fold metallo-hydrolase [Lachnospiraceae bacterium]
MRSSKVKPKQMIIPERVNYIKNAELDKLRFIWLGHSSIFVQTGGQNILIDPVFSNVTSPVRFIGPKRFTKVAIRPEDYPDIDVVVISHDHYDHLDKATIKIMDSKVSHYVVPMGVDKILKKWKISESKINVLSWWESVTLQDNQYTLTPSKHFSGRNPLKMNNTVFGGIYIKNDNYSVYYTGDGGYSKFFKEVYEKFGETDLMFAESGQYNKNWADHHMFPNQTVTACKDANARWFVPVHWGAFVLSTHAWNEPPEKTTEYAKEMGLNIATPRIGQLVDYDNIGEYQEKWWK